MTAAKKCKWLGHRPAQVRYFIYHVECPEYMPEWSSMTRYGTGERCLRCSKDFKTGPLETEFVTMDGQMGYYQGRYSPEKAKCLT